MKKNNNHMLSEANGFWIKVDCIARKLALLIAHRFLGSAIEVSVGNQVLYSGEAVKEIEILDIPEVSAEELKHVATGIKQLGSVKYLEGGKNE